MPRDFIKVDRTTVTATHASVLLQFVNELRAAYETGKKIKEIMNHNHDDVVFTDIEALFGLPAGKGQAVFDLVNGAIGSMEGTFQTDDGKMLIEQIG